MIDTAQYKQKLEAELETITAELKTLGVQNPAVVADWIPLAEGTETGEADDNVQADKNEDLETRTAIVADLETRFNNISRALQKIDDGTYGVCEISGEEIETDRLSVNPAARTCKAHLEQEGQLPL